MTPRELPPLLATAALTALLLAAAGGCSRYSSDEQLAAFSEDLSTGTWVVTSYKDQGVHLTEIFSGYALAFRREGDGNGGTLEVTGPKSLAGKWLAELDEEGHAFDLDVWFSDPPEPNDILSTSRDPIDILRNSTWRTWWRTEHENRRVYSNWNGRKSLELSRR